MPDVEPARIPGGARHLDHFFDAPLHAPPGESARPGAARWVCCARSSTYRTMLTGGRSAAAAAKTVWTGFVVNAVTSVASVLEAVPVRSAVG